MDKKRSFAGHLQQGQELGEANEVASELLEVDKFEALQAWNIPPKMRIISFKCSRYYTILFPHESLDVKWEAEIIDILLYCVTFCMCPLLLCVGQRRLH